MFTFSKQKKNKIFTIGDVVLFLFFFHVIAHLTLGSQKVFGVAGRARWKQAERETSDVMAKWTE